MASKEKPSPRSAISPLNGEQIKCLAAHHMLVGSTRYCPTGPHVPNQPEINAQNPKAIKRLLRGVSIVFRTSCKTKTWGLEQVSETGPLIAAASYITIFDVFVPMMSLFRMGHRPRYMAKTEVAK